ncbi:MAG: hypothetical protein LUF68_01515, partial [Clostridiales bacterium]|nr:hypothetical protein [Clostridiales bacterium]
MTGKVTIIGSGGVGSAIGYALNFIPSVNMIVFVDLNIRAADGEALDIGPGIGALRTASVRAGASAASRTRAGSIRHAR